MVFKLYRWVVRYKYVLGSLFLINFIIWLFCLPGKLFDDPTCTVLLDRDGKILSARIADDGQWRFPARDNVPYKFGQAILQFEDRDFYSHWGVSLKSILRAAKQNISSGEVVSGGSTVTMQLMRMSRKEQKRTFWQKIIEIYQATRAEWSYTKDEILAMYASNAPMGGNVVGLDAAAWRYFGLRPEELSWAESSMLAVLPNAPGLIHPGKNRLKLLEKRNRLLDRLYEVEVISKTELELAKLEPLPEKPPILSNAAPHLIDRFITSGKKGRLLNSTVDFELQTAVNQIVNLHHQQLKTNEIDNLSVMVLNVRSGEVEAYVGNATDEGKEGNYAVDVIKAPRSSGSILKPFLYAGLLDDGEIMPDQLIDDVPTIISGYSPKNYYKTYDGMVAASQALSRSLNVPIVKLLQQYSVPKFHHLLQQIGFNTINRPSSDYGLSLVLGGAEVSLWDLCKVYGSLANKLQMDSVFAIKTLKSEVEEKSLNHFPLNKASIYFTFNAMQEVIRPDEEAGWQQFSASKQIAWKTGTSYGFRDAWAVGVTPNYVVGVWGGNADGEGRPGLVGVKVAAPVLFDVFALLPDGGWFDEPTSEMEEVEVCAKSGFRKSMYCDEVKTVMVPKSCMKGTACPYHKVVHLDQTGRYQVNASCEDPAKIQSVNWFVLPPINERFYKIKNPTYRSLPPFKEGCVEEESGHDIAIIYPKPQSQIYVPIELSGEMGKAVFEATHRDKDAVLFWHLDNEFIGVTEGIHQLTLRPKEGKHILKVIDEQGQEVICEFVVEGREGI